MAEFWLSGQFHEMDGAFKLLDFIFKALVFFALTA